MLKNVALFIAGMIGAIILTVLALASTQPDVVEIHRSATIKAAPETLYALISDFHTWPRWSPYEQLDPAMKKTYGGAPSGLGAFYAWDGNDKGGAGRMEITHVTPPTRLVIRLDFVRPFEGHSTSEFTLAPAGDSTTVTWSMSSPMAFPHKVVAVFLNMDKKLGADFEAGLATLKAIAEQ